MNKMREIRIEKVTLNIGIGEPGDKLDKAMKLLSNITGLKPVETKTKKRIPTWNLRPNLKIAAKITLRKAKAKELLGRLLEAKGKSIKENNFDDRGNFSFGIAEYIDIPKVDYYPELGMIGLDVAVTLTRPGYRIKERSLNKRKLPTKVVISKEEAIEFIKKEFGVDIK